MAEKAGTPNPGYVADEYSRLESVLLCRPVNFELRPINEIAAEYFKQGAFPDPARIEREHRDFAAALESYGVQIVWVEPRPDLHYQVFTRDVGVTTRAGILNGAFYLPVRQGEGEEALSAARPWAPLWRNLDASDGSVFEGGDFMYLDENTVALGLGARTNETGARQIAAYMAELGVEVIPVRFDARYLHLDMILNIIGERLAVACPEALPEDFVTLLKQRGFTLVEEKAEGVSRLNCNLLAVDNAVVLSAAWNQSVNQRLRSLGASVIEVDLIDILKGGGGPHCMSFPLKRAAKTA